MTYGIAVEGVRKSFRQGVQSTGLTSHDMWFDSLKSIGRCSSRNEPRVRVNALRDITFSVRSGELFGIIGPNGAGKTTLIKILATIMPPDSGMASVGGYSVVKEREKVRSLISVVRYGGWRIFDDYISIRWNLLYWAEIYGLPRHEARDRVDNVLFIVGLANKAEEPVGNLSGGMRHKLTVAKGLIRNARFFLLDELTVGLDPRSASDIRNYIHKDINRYHGNTILLTTHNMVEAEQICDRVLILNQGEIVACGSPSELLQSIRGRVVTVVVRKCSKHVLEGIIGPTFSSQVTCRSV